jgi:hypothetical protein
MKYIVVLFLLVSGCAKNNFFDLFFPYFSDFNQDISTLGYQPIDFSKVILVEEDLPGNYRALCVAVGLRLNGESAIIKIDPSVKDMKDHNKKLVVYHEIGHCYLGLHHTENRKTIMTEGDVLQTFLRQDMEEDSLRLQYVKEMVESSALAF